jgi:hypothetical protein
MHSGISSHAFDEGETRDNNMVGGDMPLSEFIDQLKEILAR